MNNLFPSAMNEPMYFYRVTQLLHRPNETYSIVSNPFFQDFTGHDLLECRTRAYEFMLDLLADLEMAETCIWEGDGQIYAIGKDAHISHLISLIEYYNEEDYTCFPLNCENTQLRKVSMAKEYEVLMPLSIVA